MSPWYSLVSPSQDQCMLEPSISEHACLTMTRPDFLYRLIKGQEAGVLGRGTR